MKTDGIVTDPSSVENVSSIEERSNDVLHYDEPTIKPGRHKKWTREYRYTFYFFIINFVFDLLINYDIGAIPVMLNWIQDQFKFTSTELGVVGSLNYLSVFMFSTFWSYLFSNYSSKKSLTASVLIVGLSLVLFGLAVNKYMFFVAKFCKGYGHSGFALFFPLWVDTFAPSEHRNLWMSVLQSALSLGSTLGYIITSLFSYAGKHGWRYSVLTQLVLLSLTVVLFWMVPKKFIEVIPSRGDKVKFDLCTCEKAAYNPPTQQEDISRVHANFDSSTINSENPKCSKCFISTAKQCRGSAKIKTMSTIRKYVFLFRNIIFILSCLVISSIYFVIFGAQFWMTKVVVNHFNIEERKVFFIFSYIFLTSQITGLVCGSYLTDKIVYHYPHEPLYVDYALIGFTSVFCLASIAMISWKNIMTFFIGNLVVFYYSGPVPGIVLLRSLQSIDYELKPTATSIFMIFVNILGFIGGTLAPGIAVDLYNNDLAAVYIIYLPSFIAPATLILVCIIKRIRAKRITLDRGSHSKINISELYRGYQTNSVH